MKLGATAGIMNGILRFYKNQSDIELREIRIEGAKEMLLVEEIDNKEFLTGRLMRCMMYSGIVMIK